MTPTKRPEPVGRFSIVGEPGTGLERLALVPHEPPAALTTPGPGAPPPTEPMSVGYVIRALASALPADAWLSKNQSRPGRLLRPGSHRADVVLLRHRQRWSRLRPTGRGRHRTGRPGTPVVCVVGDGSTMFGVHAIWTAAQYRVPVVFVVLNNGHYGILKAFAAFQRTPGVPVSTCPVSTSSQSRAALALRPGASPGRKNCRRPFATAFQSALSRPGPVLLDVVVEAEVAKLFGDPVQ